MNNPIVNEFVSLMVQLLVSLLVWRYYRRRITSVSEKYSTFGPRFWTGCVDACVMWPVGFLVTAMLTIHLPAAFAAAAVLGQSLVWLCYTVRMHAKHGQTYGKMVCYVKVVDFKSEGAISFRQALVREVIPILTSLGILGYEIYALLTGILSPEAVARGDLGKTTPMLLLGSLPGLWFFAEVITMLTNEKRRALHDFLAGTVVIRTDAA